ncbi:MAG: CDP-alcohol phosphatidyltransferase family protein [Halobacteriota archaeon]
MSEPATGRLRRRTAVVALAFGGATLAAAAVVTRFSDAAAWWVPLSGVTLSAELWLLYRNLDRNHAHGTDDLFERFGPATTLTLVRGLLLAWLAGFLQLPWPEGPLAWAPALLYGLAAVLDYADGTLARLTDRVTVLGERLDVEFDALGLLVAPLVGVVGGQIPWWYLSVSVARYAFVAAVRLRRWRGLSVSDLPPRASRRILAGSQMAFVALALSPVIGRDAATVGAALFGGAVLLGFGRDWLAVSGRRPTDRAVTVSTDNS